MHDVSTREEEFYKRLQEIMDAHISNPDFNVDALCRVLQMSQPTLYRKIKAVTGENPTSFIRSYRLTRAAKWLAARDANISEVAKKVGFVDMSYFARCFKEQFHCLPSDIRSTDTVPAKDRQRPGKKSKSEIDREFMKELNVVIEKNFSDLEFNVERFASELYMNRSALYRKILAIYGETPTEFIRSYRLRRAAQLLECNFGNVTEVAFEVGFISSSYFAECFKKMFKRLPSD